MNLLFVYEHLQAKNKYTFHLICYYSDEQDAKH